MNKGKTPVSLITASAVLLIIVLGFTGALNIMSFQKNYSDSLVSSYAVLGRETAGKIGYAIKYGKPLDSFWGMEKLLEQVSAISPDISAVQVVLPDGQVIYDRLGAVQNRKIPRNVAENINFDNIEHTGTYTSLVDGGEYHLFFPIVDRNSRWVGSLNLKFPESVVISFVHAQMSALLKYLALVVVIGLTVLLFLTTRFSFIEPGGKVQNRKFILVILVLLGFLQVVYGFLNYHTFRKAYLEVAHDSIAAISQVIRHNVNSVLEKGVPYTELYNIEEYFTGIIAAVPELESIQIYGDDKKPLYSGGRKEVIPETTAGSAYAQTSRLAGDLHGEQGTLRMEISPGNIAGKLRSILLDTAVILVVSFILMVEVTLFVILLLEKRISGSSVGLTRDRQKISMIRYLSFLIFAAAFMSTTFIPVLMKSFYRPLMGLSQNIVLGLPLSAEMLFTALAAVGAGCSIDKTGCKPILIRGIILFGAGTLISALAGGPMTFIIARGIVGTGFGLVLTALRTMVVSTPDALTKNQGIAAMNSGAFAGINCGIVVGAMLADRIGYSQVFFVAFALSIITWYAAGGYLENSIPQMAPSKDATVETSLKSIILDKNVLAFFLLVLIPLSAVGMFLNYLFPIFADSMGASSSSIGRAFLINGLLIIYAGPFLSRYSEIYLGTRKSLMAALAITALSILIFAGAGTLAAAYAAVILLGFADSFGVAAQNNYFFSMEAVSRLSEGKAVAAFSIVGKLGQMLGPVAYGSAAGLGMAAGTGVIAIAAVIAFFLFALLNKNTACKQGLTPRDYQE